MSRSLEREQMDEQRSAAIAAAFPELAGAPASRLGEGQFAEAFVIDDVVFRFPRSEFARSKLKREAELLRAIAGELPLPTSEPIHEALEGPLIAAFVAHRLLHGNVLRSDVVSSLDTGMRDQVAAKLGAFLNRLHEVDPARVPAGTPRLSPSQYTDTLRRRVELELMPRMGEVGRERARMELGRLEVAFAAERTALCHTDIGGNVIFDRGSTALGVVDFGEAMVSHPVLDVASLSVLGDDFILSASRTYPWLAASLDGAKAVRGTFVLQDALGGASQGDWRYVDEVLAGYEGRSDRQS